MVKGILGFIVVLAVLIGLSYGFGWIGVHKKLTIGKAHQNADRVVFEQSQSFVEGKRQEALKLYKESTKSTVGEREVLCEIAVHSFANFDLSKLNGIGGDFVKGCMY